jgi:hypothetical protein
MSMVRARIFGKILASGMAFSAGALAQSAPEPTPAAASTPAGAVLSTPSVAPASPPPAAASPPAAAPARATVPPGYMLVPIPQGSADTRYNVSYPQARGALPPGMELPYEEGDTIPEGYKLRTQPRRGLIIAGSIVTGVPWVFSVMAAVGADYENKTGFLLVPAVGPWLTLMAGGGKDDDCGGTDDFCNADNAGLRSVLVLDGIVQTAGAIMFVSGFAFPRTRLVRKDVTLSFLPTTVGRDGYGIGAIGTF